MKYLEFPEYTNNQINDILLKDKINEIIDHLNGVTKEGELKEGVRKLKNGAYMKDGKLIKKSEAYVEA